ncbi:MAG: winged helix-turn-helix transcriptional regulator, partial [Mesorhizobium sp.]
AEAEERQFSHGGLVLMPASHGASFDGKPLALTGIEFAILKGFLARPTHVLAREAVMANAYAANIHVSERTVDSHIRNIRAKLAAAGCTDAIETVHGVGFRLGRCGH